MFKTDAETGTLKLYFKNVTVLEMSQSALNWRSREGSP